jgi:hypothetical protein
MGQALRLFKRRGFLPHRKQDDPNSRKPRRQNHREVERPQGWKASLALHFPLGVPDNFLRAGTTLKILWL